MKRELAFLACLAAAAAAACRTTSKEHQLERVAKDWSMTLRASQVMPVYPLTQDVQPGDVFLVQVPIDRQQEIWRDKGFLPLDNHVARIDPAGYREFYKTSFLHGLGEGTSPEEEGASGVVLPASWMRPGAEGALAWEPAPHAGFPTYAFSVRRGQGLNLALPLSGVSLGLGLMGADSADGTVSIGKARTLGIDTISLHAQAEHWARENRAFLVNYAPSRGRSSYLRVVSRVYLTGELDVSLRDASTRGAGVDAQAASPVALLLAKPPENGETAAGTTVANYEAGLNSLNEMIASGQAAAREASAERKLPGGSLRITAASGRSISMKETFDPPLVLGYLGFDCEIRGGGRLGPPVPTLAVVSGGLGGEELLSSTPAAATYAGVFFFTAYKWLREQDDEEARRRTAGLDALGERAPGSWVAWESAPGVDLVETERTREETPEASGYELFRAWRGSLEQSRGELARGLSKDTFVVQGADGETRTVAGDSAEARALRRTLEEIERRLEDPEIERAHAEARRAALDWLVGALYEGR